MPVPVTREAEDYRSAVETIRSRDWHEEEALGGLYSGDEGLDQGFPSRQAG